MALHHSLVGPAVKPDIYITSEEERPNKEFPVSYGDMVLHCNTNTIYKVDWDWRGSGNRLELVELLGTGRIAQDQAGASWSSGNLKLDANVWGKASRIDIKIKLAKVI